MTIRRSPTHLLQLLSVLQGKELLTRELFLEWVKALTPYVKNAGGPRAAKVSSRWPTSLLVKPKVESHLSHGIKGDAGFSCSGIAKVSVIVLRVCSSGLR